MEIAFEGGMSRGGEQRSDDLYLNKLSTEIRRIVDYFHKISGLLAEEVSRKAAGHYFFSGGLRSCFLQP